MSDALQQKHDNGLYAEVVDPPETSLANVARDQEMVSQPFSPESLIRLAIERNLPPDALEKLLTLHDRVKAQNARDAFNQARAKFQAMAPVIGKERTADTGVYTYNYAALEDIARHIRPLLEQCGLSYSFDSDMTENIVKCTCIIHHVQGHSESSTFTAPVDLSAKMNSMQRSASALSYAMRYSLRMALGLTTSDDNDAAYLPAPGDKPPKDPNTPNVQPRNERDTQPQKTVGQAAAAAAMAWRKKLGKSGAFSDEDKHRFAAFAAFALETQDNMGDAGNWTVERAESVLRAVESTPVEDLS